MKIECWFDGGCGPNNPGGHAGYGAIVTSESQTLFSESGYVGHGPEMSNNVAEYAGVCAVLEYLLRSEIQRATVFGDSKMVVMQLTGKMKARKGMYISWYQHARGLYRKLHERGADIRFIWIPREMNGRADYLAGQAIRNVPRSMERNRQLVKLIKAQKADAKDHHLRFERAISKGE